MKNMCVLAFVIKSAKWQITSSYSMLLHSHLSLMMKAITGLGNVQNVSLRFSCQMKDHADTVAGQA